jgi:hypothetical protein
MGISMSFLSGIIHLDVRFDFYDSIFSGGPGGWASSFGGWSVLGAETSFEVALTGYFGMAGATMDERLQNFVDIGAGTIIVDGKPNPAGGTDTLIYNAIDQTLVKIYDGEGVWTIDVFPANPYTPPPPEPGTENVGIDPNQWLRHHFGDNFDLV